MARSLAEQADALESARAAALTAAPPLLRPQRRRRLLTTLTEVDTEPAVRADEGHRQCRRGEGAEHQGRETPRPR